MLSVVHLSVAMAVVETMTTAAAGLSHRGNGRGRTGGTIRRIYGRIILCRVVGNKCRRRETPWRTRKARLPRCCLLCRSWVVRPSVRPEFVPAPTDIDHAESRLEQLRKEEEGRGEEERRMGETDFVPPSIGSLLCSSDIALGPYLGHFRARVCVWHPASAHDYPGASVSYNVALGCVFTNAKNLGRHLVAQRRRSKQYLH